MNEDPGLNSEPASSAGDTGPERAIDPILLNAVASILHDTGVLANEESRAVIRETLEDVVSEDERERFRGVIDAVFSEGEAGADAQDTVANVVDSVREGLAKRNARVLVDHEVPIPVEPIDTAVYDFVMNEDPSALSDLKLPPSVASLVDDGATCVVEGDYEAAAKAFTRAVDEAGTGDASVPTRTLAAWAHHWAGDDDAAIDFVEEALHFHADSWPPTLAGYSADPDRSFARPEQFRDGKYAAMAALRYTIDCPDGAIFTPFISLGDNDGGREWIELQGTDECTPIHRLGPDPVLRLRLAGEVPAFPAMHSYYVGLGIVDLEVTELRKVYRLLVDGPLGESVTETIRVEVDD